MPLRTSVIASRFRERQAELLKPLAEARVGGRGKKATESAAKLAEVPAGRETRKLAAAGTGYSGSSLDKVDKIRARDGGYPSGGDFGREGGLQAC